MRRPTGSAITSGGSATYGNFNDIIPNGDFATGCAKFWKKFTLRRNVRNSRIEIRESIHKSRCDQRNDSMSSILFPLIFPWRHDAIVNCVCVKHHRNQVKEKETGPKSRGGD